NDTRRLLSVLRSEEGSPVRAPQPGIDQIAALVDQVASTSLTAILSVHGDPQPIATGLGLTAYRIVQEAVTNTLRHAEGATALAVELTWTPHHLQIVVTDNGRATTRHANPAAGFGLAGMRERAGLYGGTMAAGPRPGGGWAVTATIPTAEPTAT
ncbi:MAG: sensor histidine kinase, partial [Solirubrobacteraceae bacterium]